MMCRGYYTVEATFIVTICVWMLVALCYTGFYVHDELLLESEGNEQTAAWIAEGGKEREKWEKQLRSTLQKKMFLLKISDVDAKKGLTGEKITVHYTLPVSWLKLKQMLSGKKSSLSYEVNQENVCAAKYKWDYQMIAEAKK